MLTGQGSWGRQLKTIYLAVAALCLSACTLPTNVKLKKIDELREAQNAFLVGKDRKSTRLNSSHVSESRMPSSA